MKKLLRFLLWTLVLVAVLLGLDQAFQRAELETPGYRAVRTFYLDFRQRVLALAGFGEMSVEGLIERAQQPAATANDASSADPAYVYADERGELHFADRLEDVPAAYRGSAQPLKR